jgi:pimeloyl-ACP methyl ester carboxylesterase
MLRKAKHFSDLVSATQKVVNIRNQAYPVTIDGTGKIPCLCIGVGMLMQRTFSKKFKEVFTVYTTDTYWISKGKMANPISLSMQDIVDDILEIAKQLDLKNYILAGNSCFGIVAIEVAKRQNPQIKGVMAIASAPTWSQESAAFKANYFEEHVSQERMESHKKRWAAFEKIRKPNESEVSVNFYEADGAKYWADYNVTREVLEELWHDVEAEDDMMNHFFNTLLPSFDLSVGIDRVEVPIVVSGGMHDYDSLPLVQWQTFPKPANYTLIDCGEAGHWPHYENSSVFDRETFKWVKANNNVGYLIQNEEKLTSNMFRPPSPPRDNTDNKSEMTTHIGLQSG